MKYTSIFSKVLEYTFKLVRIKNTILNSIKLELPSNHFINEFIKYIKKNNRPKCEKISLIKLDKCSRS